MTDKLIDHNGHVIRDTTKTRIKMGLLHRGFYGATSAEAESILKRDHGTVSGALSILHKDGEISLLDERRNGQRVYVLREFVGGRKTHDRVEYHCPGCQCGA